MLSLALTLSCECLSAFWVVVFVVDRDARWFGVRVQAVVSSPWCVRVCVCVMGFITFHFAQASCLSCMCV